MKVKIGDKVKMLAGKDKGKTGKVLQLLVGSNKVAVEGLNLVTKHQRPKKQGEAGQRVQFPALVDASKVAVICPKCGQPARIGYKFIEGAKTENQPSKKIKNRICRKCQQEI
ncbi:MAG TPA: 50S ribosomal protein L24 [bacterium]|nr:50S ribosomal protein L24 [bacterium]HPN80996.1 50S ribosomal protein L24 [bacterium]HPW39279.1 50S ribosomal protein L24 [bacterium]HQA64061.1 50S ribosomal protein L24 [bacterium]